MIENIDDFIAKTMREIDALKSRGRYKYFLFDVIFGMNNSYQVIFQNYFENLGYRIEFIPCGCGMGKFDIIMEWN